MVLIHQGTVGVAVVAVSMVMGRYFDLVPQTDVGSVDVLWVNFSLGVKGVLEV